MKLYQAISIGSIAFRYSRFGQLTGSILLDSVSCTGNEQILLNCSHKGHGVVSPYCNANDLSGVECPSNNIQHNVLTIHFDASLCKQLQETIFVKMDKFDLLMVPQLVKEGLNFVI